MEEDNRVEKAHWALLEQQQRLSAAFDPKVIKGRLFKLEQLRAYDRLLTRYSSGLSFEEKRYIKLVKKERNALEAKVYKFALVRLGVNLFKLTKALLQLGIKGRTAPQVSKLDQLSRFGFDDIKSKAQKKITSGEETFCIPISRSMTPTAQVDFELHFSEHGNRTGLSYFTAALKQEGKKEIKSIKIPGDYETVINDRKAFNLLEGRSVKLDNDNWLMVDWTDKDNLGNYRLKEFSAPGFNLYEQMKLLPEAQHMTGMEIGKAIKDIENGEGIKMASKDTGELTIQANPLRHRMDRFDLSGSKIEPPQVERPSLAISPKISKGVKVDLPKKRSKQRKAI